MKVTDEMVQAFMETLPSGSRESIRVGLEAVFTLIESSPVAFVQVSRERLDSLQWDAMTLRMLGLAALKNATLYSAINEARMGATRG